MMVFGRMAALMLIGLTAVYVCLFLYLRAGARMRLEDDWVMEGRPGDRGDWVGERLAPRARRIRNLLVVFVYVLPLAGLAVFVYATN